MAVRQGNNISLYIDVDATAKAANEAALDSAYTPIDGITGCSVSVSNATYETNFKNVTPATGSAPPSLASTRSYAVGTTTTTLSVEGVYDPSLTTNASELFDEVAPSDGNKTVMGVYIRDESAGFGCVGGIGFCTSFEISAGMDDFVTFSASFELTGDPHIIASA